MAIKRPKMTKGMVFTPGATASREGFERSDDLSMKMMQFFPLFAENGYNLQKTLGQIGITYQTYWQWCKHEDFSMAVKHIYDDMIFNSLAVINDGITGKLTSLSEHDRANMAMAFFREANRSVSYARLTEKLGDVSMSGKDVTITFVIKSADIKSIGDGSTHDEDID